MVTMATDAGALEATRQTAADAIRTFCRSLGSASVQISSDGVERVYYSGISLDALSVAVALALRNSAPQETRGDEPHWVKVLADNWRGRNGNTTTGDSVRNSCADELEKVAARNGFAAPHQSPRLEREGKPPQTAAASPQNYHAMLASLREAFDGADVPQKNRALRRAYDALAAILALLSPDTTVVPLTNRAACHDHPTRRCTPDDCCQRVSSKVRGAVE